MNADAQTIRKAFYDAQACRPYPLDKELVDAATPRVPKPVDDDNDGDSDNEASF